MPQFPIPRPAQPGEEIALSKKDSHHLRDVLRVRAGEEIHLFDREGTQYLAKVDSLSPQEVRLRIESTLPRVEERGELILALALLKREKMEWAIQKGVELGVKEIIPFIAARSLPKESENQQTRWTKISEEATKQCGRPTPPRWAKTRSFQGLVASPTAAQKILFWENSREPLSVQPAKGVLAVIGPEGGFASEEVADARRNGFALAGLGPRILRAETATVVALTLIQHELGNL